MISNILCKSGILTRLFTQEDFNFLKDVDTKLEVLEKKLEEFNNKKSFVTNYIDQIENKVELNTYIETLQQIETRMGIAKRCLKKADIIIENLSILKDYLTCINSNILDLVLLLEISFPNEETYLKVKEVKNLIKIYTDSQDNLQKENFTCEIYLENFFCKKSSLCEIKQAKTIFFEGNEPSQYICNIGDVPLNSNSCIPQDSCKIAAILVLNNNILRISEKDGKVYLPFSQDELDEYIKIFPDEYSSYQDVIDNEFTTSLEYYTKHPTLARFKEVYFLMRNRELESTINSLKLATNLMFKHELNPAVITACKSKKELFCFINCLSSNNLDDFKPFKIKFEINPSKNVIAYS